MLPIGVRPRQLSVRTLLAGMCLTQADGRPAHLTRVRQALASLPEADQRRLGVIADWKQGPHRLTYRQTEYTFGLVADALAKDEPDGQPSPALQATCDDLLEASVPEEFKDASGSLAVDWTDMETFSRPPPAKGGPCADPEASWGHRKNNLLRSEDELFYGYYLSAAIMMREENGPAVPELARRATLSACRHDPVRALAPVLTPMPEDGIPLGDISPTPATPTATPEPGSRSRRRRASPSRTCTPTTAAPRAPTKAPSSATETCTAPKTHAHCWNSGRSPAAPPPKKPPRTTPAPLSSPATSSAASPATTPTATTASLPRRHGQDPLPAPPAVDDPGPGPPGDPAAPRNTPRPAAPSRPSPSRRRSLAKTAQKHDYPSKAHRRSYARRTGAERGFATAKDPATNDISRGWCRLMGLAPLMLFTVTCSSSATSASSPPGTPGRQKTRAAPPTGCPRKHAGGAARPSPASPRRRHSPPRTPDLGTGTTTPRRQRKHARKQASGTENNQPGTHRAQNGRHPRRNHRRVRNARPKREHGPH